RFMRDPAYGGKPERAASGSRRRTDAAVIAPKIAIEVDVEPQPFAERTRFRVVRGGAVSDYPSRASVPGGARDDRMARQLRPCGEIGVDPLTVGGRDREHLSSRRPAQRRHELEQQA